MRKPKVSRFVLFEPFIALAKPTDYHCQESTKAEVAKTEHAHPIQAVQSTHF